MERVYSSWTVKARNKETGKVFEDKIPASSEREAIVGFGECYRHEIYTILEVTEGEPYKEREENIMRDEKFIEKMEQEMPIEKLWDFACGGNTKALEDYYLSECGTLNRRYNQFGEEHSLIMGAFRNGELDTVEYLMEVGETVTHKEEQEILDELHRIDIMRKLTKATNKQ